MHDSLYLFKRGPLALGHEPGVFKRPSNQLIATNDVEAGPAQHLDFVKRQGDISSECVVHYATGMGVGLFVPKGSLIDRHAFDNSDQRSQSYLRECDAERRILRRLFVRELERSAILGLLTGITMALRDPHKRMKLVGRRIPAYCIAILPLPSPSGFRPRLGVWGMLSITGITYGLAQAT